MAPGVVAPAPTQTTTTSSSHVTRPTIPPGLVPMAVLLAVAVGLLALLPSLAQAVWEVPHLFLLGLVISYGVFTQRNADAGNATSKDRERSLAWNARARYHPDGPLVVVAAREPSESGGNAGDAFGEETDSCAPAFWAGARAAPSPPSVLDADLGLSPCSQPQSSPRPISVLGVDECHGPNAAAKPFTVSRGAFVPGHSSPVPGDQPWRWSDDGGEGTDWDEEEDAEGADEMTTVSSERSARDDFEGACAYDHHSEGGDTSVDEELFELAAKAEPDGEEEVDRKAEEFIAKFREQIRMQRH
ncbi:unnamed protein product [Urochloa decumbens]|uniref:Uncharacterized protein n=1 Tax=Urochloa decumbens TaxID=240449 RepID=A0ABC8V9Q5_9POAL